MCGCLSEANHTHLSGNTEPPETAVSGSEGSGDMNQGYMKPPRASADSHFIILLRRAASDTARVRSSNPFMLQ